MKILALDSVPAALDLLEQHCRAVLGPRFECFTRVPTLAAAQAALAWAEPDVVLLDSPDGGDLTLPASLDDRPLQVIVVSTNPALAVAAFEQGALDFLPKPVARDRLAKALLRVRPATPPAVPTGRHLAVRRRGRIDLVPVDDLLYAEGSDKYSELVLTNGQRSFHDQCLGRLEAALPRSFVRIHKSYLVRFPSIARLLVLRGSRYFAVLKNGQRLPVGRSRYAQIKSRLI